MWAARYGSRFRKRKEEVSLFFISVIVVVYLPPQILKATSSRGRSRRRLKTGTQVYPPIAIPTSARDLSLSLSMDSSHKPSTHTMGGAHHSRRYKLGRRPRRLLP